MCNPWLGRQARDSSVLRGPSSNARLVRGRHGRLATFIMSDNPLRVEKVIDRVLRSGEPEWRARDPPRFIRHPKTAEDLTHNFRQYMTGFPWMVVAKDKAGYMRYHCGICRKVATICRILSDHHIDKTSTHFRSSLGHTIPRWMERFKGFNTRADPTEVLFDENEHELWPEVCDECNCNLYQRLISMDVTSVDPRQHRHLRTHEFTAMITPLAARTGGPSPGKAKQLMSGVGPDKSSSQLRHRHPKITA